MEKSFDNFSEILMLFMRRKNVQIENWTPADFQVNLKFSIDVDLPLS